MKLVNSSCGVCGYGGLAGYVWLPLEGAELCDESSAMVSGYCAVLGDSRQKEISR